MMDMRGLGDVLMTYLIIAIIISAVAGVVLWELAQFLYRHLSWAWN